MTISLQSTFPPGYIPPGVDPKTLDPATRKAVETTGITLQTALKLIGLESNDVVNRVQSLVNAMLPAPEGAGKEVGDPFGKFTASDVAIDIYSVMALFQKCAQEMRNMAREARAASLQAQVTNLMNAADEIREAAEQRLQAAIIQGSFQIAGGVMSAGLSVASAVYGAKGIKAEPESIEAKTFDNKAKLMSGLAQSTGGVMGGIGSMAAAGKERELFGIGRKGDE